MLRKAQSQGVVVAPNGSSCRSDLPMSVASRGRSRKSGTGRPAPRGRDGMTAQTAATELPELEFAAGLPGFPESKRFALTRWADADGPYRVLVDLDNPD